MILFHPDNENGVTDEMPRNIVKILDKDFSDLKAGQKMLISSPEEIARYISEIPKGTIVTPKQMRRDLAQQHGADNSCPVSTGIFLRLAIEEALAIFPIEGSPLPFWRLVDEKHPVLKKLGIAPEVIKRLRQAEAKTD
ncbi:MAG: hypothetical protein ACON44_00660 [Candidatus Puniceispirillaceae bacterium]